MDVVVVGCGFVGSFLAYLLAKKGTSVAVYEEHHTIGYPQHCAGLVSVSGLRRLGILEIVEKESIILNRIRCAKVIADRKSITICRPVADLLVVDRPLLDRLLAEKAEDYGASIHTGAKVQRMNPKGLVRVDSKNVEGSIIVDAEGAGRRLLRSISGEDACRLPALQMDIVCDQWCDEDTVEVHVNTPDFYTWIIPLRENIVRVGTASRTIGSFHAFLRAFCKRRFGRIRVLRKFGGTICTDGPLRRFVYGRIAVVGDAAGQTKPTTGGGIVIGGLSACILAKVIELSLDNIAGLKLYEKSWWKTLGPHIMFMRTLRRIMFGLDVRWMANTALWLLAPLDTFVVSGDYDFQIDIIARFFNRLVRMRRGSAEW